MNLRGFYWNKNMKRVLCIALTLMSCSAFAQTYRIGVENISYYPYSEVYEGEYVGVGRDILDLFASKSGYKFEYVHGPLARNKILFLNTTLDFLYPDSEFWSKPEKESSKQVIKYSDGFVEYIDGVTVLTQDSQLNLDRLQSLGTIIGFTPVEAYLELERASKIKLNKNTSVNSLIQQLILGRVNGVYLSKHVVQHQFKLLGKDGFATFRDQFPTHQGVYKISTILHPEMLDEFNQFLSNHHKEIALIKKQYGLLK